MKELTAIKQAVLESKEKKLFTLIALIGSSDFNHIGHDIDILFLGKPDASPTLVLKAQHEILRKIQKNLSKLNKKAIFFNRFAHQAEIAFIAKYNPKKHILIHSLLFFDTVSMRKITPENFHKFAYKTSKPIYGNPKALLSLYKNKKVKQGHVVMATNALFFSGLPKSFMVEKTKLVARYVLKWNKIPINDKEKLKNLLANLKTEKDCRTLYYYLSKRME